MQKIGRLVFGVSSQYAWEVVESAIRLLAEAPVAVANFAGADPALPGLIAADELPELSRSFPAVVAPCASDQRRGAVQAAELLHNTWGDFVPAGPG